MEINVNEITVKSGRRSIDDEKVNELVISIMESGLINPITVSSGNVLIAGAHRLEAFRRLGRKAIECNVVEAEGVHAELIEIDENLVRNELHYIDSGNLTKRRKEIYEELHPETKREATLRQNLPKDQLGLSDNKVPSFVKDTAAKTGKSASAIKRELQIANNVIPEVKEVIKSRNISQEKALAVAKVEPSKQMETLERLQKSIKTGRPREKITARDLEMLDQMTMKKPSEEGDGQNTGNLDNSSISEFMVCVTDFRVRVNKFLSMPYVFSELTERSAPIKELIRASEDIEQIMGMIKGVEL